MKRSLKYSPTQTLGGAKGALYVVKYNCKHIVINDMAPFNQRQQLASTASLAAVIKNYVYTIQTVLVLTMTNMHS